MKRGLRSGTTLWGRRFCGNAETPLLRSTGPAVLAWFRFQVRWTLRLLLVGRGSVQTWLVSLRLPKERGIGQGTVETGAMPSWWRTRSRNYPAARNPQAGVPPLPWRRWASRRGRRRRIALSGVARKVEVIPGIGNDDALSDGRGQSWDPGYCRSRRGPGLSGVVRRYLLPGLSACQCPTPSPHTDNTHTLQARKTHYTNIHRGPVRLKLLRVG